MTLRRLLLLAGVLLILFLGMYSWNQRTRFLDDMAAKLGLEITGAVLTPIRSAQDAAENMWARYFDLVPCGKKTKPSGKRWTNLKPACLPMVKTLPNSSACALWCSCP